MKHSKFEIQNSKFFRYDRYKDSGVEWLGEIPEHWSVSKTRWLWKEVEDPSENGDEQLLSISQYTGVTPANAESRSESLVGYRRCKPDDLAMNIMLAWQGGLGVSDYEGIVSPAYSVFRLRGNNNAHYLGYLYRTKHYLDEFGRNSTGIVPSRWRLYPDKFGHILTLLPPKPEQDRIVAFLDQKTAEIDALIAKKQRQIELLDEQKAIQINLAVTRGIVNSEFGMKNEHLSSSSHSTFTTHNSKFSPSGIEWIGDIPDHWITAPMYSRCDVRLGKMLDAAKIRGKHLQPYLRNTDVQWFEINSLDLPTMDFRPDEYERYSVKRGDLVVCEGGEPGRAALWDRDEPCFFQKALHRVRPVIGDDPRFLLYLFRNAVTMSAFSGVDKATIAHLTGEQLRRFRFAFPPVTEQVGIAAYLSDAQLRFSETTQKIENLIDSLNTLRSTLIAHAVIGKIKLC